MQYRLRKKKGRKVGLVLFVAFIHLRASNTMPKDMMTNELRFRRVKLHHQFCADAVVFMSSLEVILYGKGECIARRG